MNKASSIFSLTFSIAISFFPAMALSQSISPKPNPQSEQRPHFAKAMVELDYRTKSLEFELKRLSEVRRKLQKDLDVARSAEDEAGVSSESFPEIMKNLQAKRIDLMIDIAGLEARRDAIVEAREKSQAEREDKLIEPLQDIIAIQQTELKQAVKNLNDNVDTKIRVSAARKALLESKIRLGEAMSSGTNSTTLVNSLLNTSLELAEKKARLSKSETLLKGVLPSRVNLDKTRVLNDRLRAIEDQEKELQFAIRRAEAEDFEFQIQLKRVESKQP